MIRNPKVLHLTAEQDDHLANWFKDRPYLYDLTHRDYKNESKKREQWRELANYFHCDWELLAKYAKGLRDRVGKLLRKEEGASGSAPVQLTDREVFILTKYRFLKEHLRRVTDSRKRRTSVGIVKRRAEHRTAELPPLPTLQIPDPDQEETTQSTFSDFTVRRVSFSFILFHYIVICSLSVSLSLSLSLSIVLQLLSFVAERRPTKWTICYTGGFNLM